MVHLDVKMHDMWEGNMITRSLIQLRTSIPKGSRHKSDIKFDITGLESTQGLSLAWVFPNGKKKNQGTLTEQHHAPKNAK